MYNDSWEMFIRRILPHGVNDPHFYVTLNNHERIKKLQKMQREMTDKIVLKHTKTSFPTGRNERRVLKRVIQETMDAMPQSWWEELGTVANALLREYTIEENKKLKK